VTTTLVFLQIAVPVTVAWWGGGLWLWRRHRPAGPLVAGERRVVGMVLAWVVVTLVELTVLVIFWLFCLWLDRRRIYFKV